MFKKKTTFVLGAGASYPYDYPLGDELIVRILQALKDQVIIIPYEEKRIFWNENDIENNIYYDFSKIKNFIQNFDEDINGILNLSYAPSGNNIPKLYEKDRQNKIYHTTINRIKQFYDLEQALKSFASPSIDTFLRDNPKFAEAGKIMIMYTLLSSENKKKFGLDKLGRSLCRKGDNWYTLLLNEIVSGCAENPKNLLGNKFDIVTFNYDVSLDYYLQTFLKEIEIFNDEGQESSIADQFLAETLNIHHIYGSLHKKNLVNENYGQYANDSNYDDKQKLVNNFERFRYSINNHSNIKTMYSERNPSDLDGMVNNTIKNILFSSEEIIFIGFGFDPDNLSQIGMPNKLQDYLRFSSPKKIIRYMNYGGEMSSIDFEFEKIEAYIEQHMSRKPSLKVIRSIATSIKKAYLNDFKKYLISD